MDPETYDYAQAAGILPHPSAVDQGTGIPQALQGFTDEDILASVVPGYVGSDVPAASTQPPPGPPEPGLITSPTAEISQAPQEVTGPAVNFSEGASAKTRGYSPEKARQIAGGPAARELAQTNADIDRKSAADTAAFAGALGTASQQASDAIDAKTKAQIDYDTEVGKQKSWLADQHRDFALKEAEAEATAQSEISKRRADYIKTLNEFRDINPGELWQNMTGGQHVGMLAAAFVQDYLGPKGIKTSAMDTLNKAIDRNINAQISHNQNVERRASGFKTAWDMVRAQSASEAEARARIRGIYLESFKNQVESHMAQFSTGLTKAAGEAAKADLKQALVKEVFGVYKHIDASVNTQKGQAIQKYSVDLQNAQAMAELALKRAELAKKKKEEEKDPNAYLLYDTSEGGNGQARWVLRPEQIKHDGTPSDAAQKYLEKQAATESMNRSIKEYRALIRAYGNKSVKDKGRFRSTNAARIDSLRNDILAARVKAISGAAATDKEVERLSNSVPDQLWGTQFDTESVISGFQKRALSELNQSRYTIANELSEDDPRRKHSVKLDSFDEAGYIDARVTDANAGREPESSVVDIAQKTTGSDVDRTGPASEDLVKSIEAKTNVDPRFSWEKFHVDNARNNGKYDSYGYGGNKPTEYEAVVAGLYDKAKTGDPKAIEELKVIKALGDDVKFKQRGPVKEFTGNGETRYYAGQMATWALDNLSQEDIHQQSIGHPQPLDVLQHAIDAGVVPRRTED